MGRNVKILLTLAAVLALFALSACKSDADKMVGYMEEMAEIIDSNKGDCDKMGDALSSFADDNGEDMKKVKDNLEKLSDDEEKELKEKYKDRMDAAEKKFEGLGECIMNEKVGKALEKIKI